MLKYSHADYQHFEHIYHIKLRFSYSSAVSNGIYLFTISHLFPAIKIGVSFGKYFLNSFTQTLTLSKESTSVISYTTKAPIGNLVIKKLKRIN